MVNVQLFIPCFVDQLYPQTGMNMVKVLEKAGCKVHFNPDQTCCGQPAYNAGYWEDAKSVAGKFIHDFDKECFIVGPSGSCTGFIRSGYPRLFKGDKLETGANRVVKYAYEFTEFLTEVLNVDSFGAAFPEKVTYHDSCGALRECGIKNAPRRLLQNVKGLELIESGECETCCGFGGTFAVKFESISTGMAHTKVQSALTTGARYIASTDVSCLMHMQAYIEKNGYDLQTIHVADIVANW